MKMSQTASYHNPASNIYRLFAILLTLLSACSARDVNPTAEAEVPMSIELTSPVFKNGEAIPQKYSCDGEDISPPLHWDNVPAGTTSLALIMDDPDAPRGTWVHWVLYNIPPATNELPENVAPVDSLPGEGSQGNNSWKRVGYGGPCPPVRTHRYFFKIYALNTQLSLDAGATKADVLQTMEGHILAQGHLMGTYERK